MPTEVLADDAALRAGRRARAFAEMDAHDIDVLVLGREANARYIAGAQRLWTGGTRPFGAGCVVVRATRSIHLVSTWDEGIPDDIPHENLFGITWNPGNLFGWLGAIEGVAGARRVGTDSLSPGFSRLLPTLWPNAEHVDAEPILQAARRIKTPEEVDVIRSSLKVAEAALEAAVGELRPGIEDRDLTGTFMDAMASHGVTTPSTQRVAWIARGRAASNAKPQVQTGDLVAFDAGVVAGGYIGEVGRTWPAGTPSEGAAALYRRADDLWATLLDACRPGATGSDLLDAYRDADEPLPPMPVASGLGLGFDLPLIVRDLPATAAAERLDPGVVIALTAYVEDDSSAVFRKDAVRITAHGPEVLTCSPHWRPSPPDRK